MHSSGRTRPPGLWPVIHVEMADSPCESPPLCTHTHRYVSKRNTHHRRATLPGHVHSVLILHLAGASVFNKYILNARYQI